MRLALIAAVLIALGVAGSAQGEATTERQDLSMPLNDTLFSPCGETVHLEGEVHFFIYTMTDANGGVHYKGHINYSGVSGTGTVSGTRYTAAYNVNDNFNFDF